MKLSSVANDLSKNGLHRCNIVSYRHKTTKMLEELFITTYVCARAMRREYIRRTKFPLLLTTFHLRKNTTSIFCHDSKEVNVTFTLKEVVVVPAERSLENSKFISTMLAFVTQVIIDTHLPHPILNTVSITEYL